MGTIGIVIGVRPHYVKARGIEILLQDSGIIPFFFDVHQHYDEYLRGQHVNTLINAPIINSSLEKNVNPYHDFSRQINDLTDWLLSDFGQSIDAVMVLGDASPALSGAIAANRIGKRIIHLEAGARRIKSELEHWNSLIADHLSDIRYCYTQKCVDNLSKEGLVENTYFVGDVLANWTINTAEALNDNIIDVDNYCLVSIHRPQNCNEKVINELCIALKSIEKKIVWIIHPRIAPYIPIIKKHLDVLLMPPQDHDAALALMKFADLIITDSGGFVREGVLLSKRVIACHEKGLWEDLSDNHCIEKTKMEAIYIKEAISKTQYIDIEAGKRHFIKEDGAKEFIESLREFLS